MRSRTCTLHCWSSPSCWPCCTSTTPCGRTRRKSSTRCAHAMLCGGWLRGCAVHGLLFCCTRVGKRIGGLSVVWWASHLAASLCTPQSARAPVGTYARAHVLSSARSVFIAKPVVLMDITHVQVHTAPHAREHQVKRVFACL